MPYTNHGIAWDHPERGPRYAGRIGIHCSTCKHEDDVEQVYGHEYPTGEPCEIASMDGAIRNVRARLASLGWDVSPDDDPLTADYCPDCCQGTHWRH